MSYFVCHGQKAKSGDVKNIERHIERKNQNYKNKDIDSSKTYLNYDLHNKTYSSYKKRIDDRIKEDYKGTRAIRKDATMMVNFIISSDNDFFKDLSEDQVKEYFKISYEYLRDYFGEKNVISAKVHLDETTPHMHFCAVPLVDGKLNAKSLMTRGFLRQIQKELPEILKIHNFKIDRGIEGSKRSHKDTEQYKKEIELDMFRLERDIEIKETEKDTIEKRLKASRNALKSMNRLSGINLRKTLIGNNRLISEGEYNDIRNSFSELILDKYNLEDKVSSLESQLNSLYGRLERTTYEKDKLVERLEKYQIESNKNLSKIKNELFDEKDNARLLRYKNQILTQNLNDITTFLDYINKSKEYSEYIERLAQRRKRENNLER